MTRSSWVSQLNQSRAKKRREKTDLLPLPQRIADVLSLEYHLLLEALRAGVCSFDGLRILTRVALATTMLAEEGFGNVKYPFPDLEEAAYRSFESGKESGLFRFDDTAFHLFAHVVTAHDLQIMRTPVIVIEKLALRLEAVVSKNDTRTEGRRPPPGPGIFDNHEMSSHPIMRKANRKTQ